MDERAIRILKIDSSARFDKSYSRLLTRKVVDKLSESYPRVVIKDRNISFNTPFLSEAMVEVMFLPAEKLTDEQKYALQLSDDMVKELRETDVLVLGVPIYNFSIPASLKAYIDLVVRAGLTFTYAAGEPKGLIENLKAYIVVTSGGTLLHSNFDFVSSYMKLIFGFMGIREIHFIDATQIALKGGKQILDNAMAGIRDIGQENSQ